MMALSPVKIQNLGLTHSFKKRIQNALSRMIYCQILENRTLDIKLLIRRSMQIYHKNRDIPGLTKLLQI